MFELNKFFKYLLLIFIGLVISISSFAAIITAAADGDWNVGATWVGGIIPTNADDVVIPTGITVTVPLTYNAGDLDQDRYTSLEVSGTLDIKNNMNLSEWAGVDEIITIKNGGTIITANDVYFGTDRSAFTIEAGGTLTVGDKLYDSNTGDIIFTNNGTVNVTGDYASNRMLLTNNVTGTITVGGSFTSYKNVVNYSDIEVTGNIRIEAELYNYAAGTIITHATMLGAAVIRVYNYGYIEVDLDIENDGIFTNYGSGLVLVHGSLKGSSNLRFHNYGIVTVDGNLSLIKTHVFNYDTGILITFGEIYVGEGSDITNSGLIQCVDFRYAANPSGIGLDNTNGTLIVIEEITIEGTNCPGCSTTLGTLYYGAINVNAATCAGYSSCSDFLAGGRQVDLGRRLWLAADFIGYGLETDNERIIQWFDLACYYGFEMSQSVVANQPILKNNITDNVNFNPVMSFEGNQLTMDLNINNLYALAVDGGIGVFAVVVPKTNVDQFVFDYGLYPTDGYGLMYDTDNVTVYTPTASNGVVSTTAHTKGTTPTIISQTTTWGVDQKLYLNGTLAKPLDPVTLAQIEDAQIADAKPFTLGGQSANTASYDFEGKIAELIVYAKNVDASTRLATESFLALKYGLTLPNDYYDYTGTTVIYDLDGTYDNAIVGLSRQDLNYLHQRQSKSLVSGEELTIAIDDIVAFNQSSIPAQITLDNSFFICGRNANTIASGNRIYKVTSTNFTQQVTLEFDIAGLAAPYYELLVDDNSGFTSPTAVSYTNIAGDKITFENVFANNTTSYFKLSAILPVTQNPGVGINTEAIHNSAELHVVSTDKGILLPALASEAAIVAAPTAGLIFYNTTHKRFMYYDGTVWKFVGEPLKQDNATLTGSTGSYTGEMRYDTTNKVMYIWNGTIWVQLKNN